MNFHDKVDSFLLKLKNYYRFEIGYDNSFLLVENIKKTDEYSLRHKEYLLNKSFMDIIQDLSEGLFQVKNDKNIYICYLIIEEGLCDEAFIYREVRDQLIGEYVYWHDLYKSPIVLIGYNTVKEEIIFNFITGAGSVNWEIFHKLKTQN